MLRAGFCQFSPRFGHPAANLDKVLGLLAGAEADLLVLPELPFSGYNFRNRSEAFDLAEKPAESGTIEALAEMCRSRRFHVVTGFLERDGDRLFNSSLLIGRRGVLETYRKIHLFRDEKSIFAPGDRPPRVRRVGGARVGMMICFDWVYPEVARMLALQGMDLLCHPSNLVLRGHCQKAMLTRCLENSVFAITANRTGVERRAHGTLRYTGRSQIVGPRGDLLHRAPAAAEQVHVETIDPSRARDKKLTPRNDLLRDRRPELYVTG